MTSFTLATLWHGRHRYIPAVLAVAFSALLVTLQCGLMLGALSVVSLPIDHSSADIWVGAPNLDTVDVCRPIPLSWRARLDMPEVERSEPFVRGCPIWQRPDGGSEYCVVIGSRLHADALGCMAQLTPEMRARLSEPGAVIVDAEDLDRLGVPGVGATAEVSGRRVRIVGLVHGMRGIVGPHVFCSFETGQRLVGMNPDQTSYVLARCRDHEDAGIVVSRLRQYPRISAFTAGEFSEKSRWHWLSRTGGGVALGLSAGLGLLVSAVVTSQTLYGATVTALREFAVLRAMGIPRWRMGASVMTQSLWIGLAGTLLALPIVFGLAPVGIGLGATVLLPMWLLSATVVITLTVAVISGCTALRSLRLIEPAVLLR